MKRSRILTALVAICPFTFLLAGVQGSGQVSYSNDIVPIFRAHCFSCHSGEKSAAGLKLDSSVGLLKGGASGKIVAPGNADGSALLVRVLGKDGRPRMPMGFGALPGDQIEVGLLCGGKVC